MVVLRHFRLLQLVPTEYDQPLNSGVPEQVLDKSLSKGSGATSDKDRLAVNVRHMSLFSPKEPMTARHASGGRDEHLTPGEGLSKTTLGGMKPLWWRWGGPPSDFLPADG